MSAQSTSNRPLTQLNFEIEELEGDQSRLEEERIAIVKESRRASRQLSYLRYARLIRKPVTRFEMWPIALIVVGGGLIGFSFVVLVSIVSGSLPLSWMGFVVGMGTGAVLFASLLYRPPDAQLPAAIDEAESQSRLLVARLQEKTQRIAETNSHLQQLIDKRRDQIASGKLQRAALLQRPWKGMHGDEWEDFLVEVLRTHGATVERSRNSTDKDSLLLADSDARRIAILLPGEGNTVSSATIHTALSAKEREHCDSCAVIINRRFTGAAQDFAQRNGCAAIGASEFPDFVLGKITL